MVIFPNVSFISRRACFIMLHPCSRHQFFSPVLGSKLCAHRTNNPLITLRTFTETDFTEFENYVQSNAYVEQQPKFALLNLPRVGHDFLVVQPQIKKGKRLRTDTTTALQLAEAVTLLETLPGWKAAGRLTLKTDNDMRKLIFKSGNLERIQDSVKEKSATAIFINFDILTGVQHAALQEFFRLPIYDRYTVVLNIFRNHARTKEAKLQIALAEIPYYRARIWHLHKGTGRNTFGTGQTYYERQQQQLQTREAALRRQLAQIKDEHVIVHVLNLSHPDREAQRSNVLETLDKIGVPQKLLDSMIQVGNKVDLLPSSVPENGWECIPVSCMDGTGLAELRVVIEQRLIENTGRSVARFRVSTGGSEYSWLYREGTFISSIVDAHDSNYSIVDVVLSTAAKAKFKHLYGSMCAVD
ncbi:hypothetical protein MRX96_020522 [Rhipicephalus microplus]